MGGGQEEGPKGREAGHFRGEGAGRWSEEQGGQNISENMGRGAEEECVNGRGHGISEEGGGKKR